MACFIVKIQYGDVLRRMNLDGAGDHEFRVSYIQNRARELFKLPAGTEAEFTYIDAEGDVVALADDHDVDDALFQQGLNPLRITMVTKTPATNALIPDTGSSSSRGDSSVAVNAAAVDQLPSTLDDVITSAQTRDIETIIAEEWETWKTPAPDGTQIGDIEALIADEGETWKTPSAAAAAPAENHSPSPLSYNEAVGRTSPNSKHSHRRDEALSVASPGLLGRASSGSLEVEAEAEAAVRDSAANTEAEAEEGEEEEEEELESGGEEKEGSFVKNVAEDAENAVSANTTTPPAEEADDIHWGVQCNGCLKFPIKGPRFRSCKRSNYDLCLRCFASKVYDGEVVHTEFVRLSRRFHRLGDPANSGMTLRSLQLRRLFSTLLQGSKSASSSVAQCDECGLTPIEGPRFKSRTRFNYDLCQGCFERSGSDDREYSRIAVADHRPPVSAAPPVAPTALARQGCIGGANLAPAFTAVEATWESLMKMVSVTEGQYQRVGALYERVMSDINPWKPIHYEIVRNEKKISTPVPIVDAEAEAAPELQADGSKHSHEAGVTDGSSVQSDANVDASEIIDTMAATSILPGKAEDVIDAKGENASSSSSSAEALPAAAEGGLLELLVKLRDMGYNDEALNKELLERNGLNLPKTLDDLCEKEDWDPILEELEEMGFYDTDMNRRLMIQKQGSVKQVVKELVRVAKGENQA